MVRILGKPPLKKGRVHARFHPEPREDSSDSSKPHAHPLKGLSESFITDTLE
jgi:hypothetical protein